jgi:TonB-dependent starch-binding outer membrane protein SusC
MMRSMGWVVALCIATALPCALHAQERGSIGGRVVDRTTGQPITGAQVAVTGTALSTLTNQQGRYLLVNVPAGQHEVRVSVLGYSRGSQVVTVAAGQTATHDFQLAETAVELEAIHVTATGQEQRRREVGNSVSTISTEAVELAAVQNLTNLLQGRAAGVVIQPTSGSMGTGSRIRIRGNSSVSLSGTPLLVVDGIRVSNESESSALFTGGISTTRWDDINPEDIESIEILKGPAASALYGTAAANGVVQITTKRGIGGRTEVRTYAEMSSHTVPTASIPDNVRARGFRTDLGAVGDCSLVERAAGVCAAADSVYRYNPLLQAPGSPLGTGNQGKVGISLAGGTEDRAVTYFLGVERQEGTGVMRDNEQERTNLRANFAGNVTDRLRVGANTNFVTSHTELPQEGNTGSGAFLNAFFGADPSPANVQRGGGFRNPYTALNVGWWRNEEELRRFVGSINADWRPTHWLNLTAVSGVDQSNRFEQSTIPVPGLATGFFSEGLREQYRGQAREFTANLNAHVNRPLSSRVTSSSTLGVQYNETTNDWTYAAGSGLAPGTLTTGEALSVQEFFGETKLFGIYGWQQFAINDRLFLTAAVRGDQNSAFGENIGFVVYPALSASWVIREEPWFPEAEMLSSLRLRAAYGESGQRPDRLSAVRTYQTQAVTLGGAIGSGFIVSNAGNPDLTAEVSREFEFGLDMGLFQDRLGLELTRYDKRTRDALVARPLPPSVGGPTSQFYNLGAVTNTGWEGAVRLEALRARNVDARVGMTFSTNRNRLVAIGDTTIPPITIGTQRHVEGYALGGYWSVPYEWADLNNDRIIQFDEVWRPEDEDGNPIALAYYGSPLPTHELSFTMDVNVMRMFRVSGLLDYKGGHKLFNWTARLRCAEAAGSYCEARQIPENASLEDQARIIARRHPDIGSQAGYIEDADFWKLRELALTFTVPTEWVNRLRFTRALSISVAGRNLKTWTGYSGIDPESNIPGSVDTTDDPGRFYTVDMFTVPMPRTFVLRVDMGL